jgi:hypothetical protein
MQLQREMRKKRTSHAVLLAFFGVCVPLVNTVIAAHKLPRHECESMSTLPGNLLAHTGPEFSGHKIVTLSTIPQRLHDPKFEKVIKCVAVHGWPIVISVPAVNSTRFNSS